MNVQEPSQVYAQTIFYCMPIRLGVLLSALVTWIISLVYVCSRYAYYETFRNWAGGYALASRIVVGVFETTGVVFALLGVLGTWYTKPKWVATYNYWQVARFFGWLYVFHIDVPLLLNCEAWINNITTETQQQGWNQLMYDVAMDAACSAERTRYFLISPIVFLLFAYITYKTFEYRDCMNRIPKHLLQLPKDVTSSAFYSHSPGDTEPGVVADRHIIGRAPHLDPELAPLIPPRTTI